MTSTEDGLSRSSESSPDPLSKSIDRLYPPSSPLKRTRESTDAWVLRESSPSTPRGTSPSKIRGPSQTRFGDLTGLEQRQSIIFHTPAKTFEGAGAVGSSPWKIRVTVEAEPDEQEKTNTESRNMTIMVPLRGEDEYGQVRRRLRRRGSIEQLISPNEQASSARGVELRSEDVSDSTTTASTTSGAGHTPSRKPGRPRKIRPSAEIGGNIIRPKEVTNSFTIASTAVDTDDTPSKRRGRPRRVKPSSQGDGSDNRSEDISTSATIAPVASGAGLTPANKRGRPKKTMSSTVETQPLDALPRRTTRMDFAALTPLYEKGENVHLLESATLLTPATQKRARVAAASRKIRDRIPTPRKPAGYDKSKLSPLPLSSPEKISQERGSEYDLPLSDEVIQKDVDIDSSLLNDATFIGDGDDEELDEDNTMTGVEDDTSTLDRSAVESEGFSMVSIDSLKNQRMVAEKRIVEQSENPQEHSAKHTEHVISRTVTLARKATLVSANLVNSFSNAFERSSDHQASHQMGADLYNAPVLALQQTLHSTVEKSTLDARDGVKPLEVNDEGFGLEATPTESNQMEPGLDLCNAILKPNIKYPIGASGSRGRERRTKDLFAPFGDGTKRQLRAGLAMGELLARAEKGFVQNAAANLTNDDETSPQLSASTTTDSPTYPRLPTPAESVVSNNGADKDRPITRAKPPSPVKRGQAHMTFLSSPPSSSSYDEEEEQDHNKRCGPSIAVKGRSTLDRKHRIDQLYQREREDVIRQIQEANTSRVLVISSDDDHEQEELEANGYDEEEEYGQKAPREATLADIWQEEADRSLDNSVATRINRRKRKQQELEQNIPDLRELLGEDLQPPRAKIPRTWRRTSRNDFLYSDESELPKDDPVVSHDTVVLPSIPVQESPLYNSELVKPYSVEKQAYLRTDPSSKFSKVVLSSPLHHTNSRNNSTKHQHDSAEQYNIESNHVQNIHETFIDDVVADNAENLVDVEYSAMEDDRMSSPFGAESQVHQEEDSSLLHLHTSDVRQLKRELIATANRIDSSIVIDSQDDSSVIDHERKSCNEVKMFRPDSNKATRGLFHEGTENPQSQQAAPAIQTRNTLQPFKQSQLTNTRYIFTAPPTTTETSTYQPGLLTRLFSWFAPPKPAAHANPWNRNHYLLLDHYWTLSLTPDSTHRGPPLPACYHDPLSSLPADLTNYLNRPINTKTTRDLPGIISEHWVRVSWAFMVIAKEEGVPVLCGGELDPRREEWRDDEEFPMRDEMGRVVRVREEWGAWDVVRRVWALWVRDFVRREGGVRVGLGREDRHGGS